MIDVIDRVGSAVTAAVTEAAGNAVNGDDLERRATDRVAAAVHRFSRGGVVLSWWFDAVAFDVQPLGPLRRRLRALCPVLRAFRPPWVAGTAVVIVTVPEGTYRLKVIVTGSVRDVSVSLDTQRVEDR